MSGLAEASPPGDLDAANREAYVARESYREGYIDGLNDSARGKVYAKAYDEDDSGSFMSAAYVVIAVALVLGALWLSAQPEARRHPDHG